MSEVNSTLTAAPEIGCGTANACHNAILARDNAGGYEDTTRTTSALKHASTSRENAPESIPAKQPPGYLLRYAERIAKIGCSPLKPEFRNFVAMFCKKS